MISLPVLTRLEISNYGLFPGDPSGSGIAHNFEPGLTMIAGINGLGKTTILTAILRALTGPFDLTGAGAPMSLGVTVPQSPVALNRKRREFFSQRVADSAAKAQVRLYADFSGKSFLVIRNLSDLSLVSCTIDGQETASTGNHAQRETDYQAALASLMKLGSFVDVLLVLHYVLLFHEERPGALWDTNAQRQLLRALFLDKDDATTLAGLERSVQSADSQARNIRTRITSTEKELAEKISQEAGVQGVSAELQAEQKLLDAELEEIERLEKILSDLDEERRQIRLEHEKAKMAREEASGSVERLKYGALVNLYPTMDEAARLVIARIMTEAKCLVCSSDAPEKQKELEDLVEHGCCPACGANSKKHDQVVPQHKFEQAKLDAARKQFQLAKTEEEQKATRLKVIALEYEDTLSSITSLRRSVSDRKSKSKRLRGQLPSNITSAQLEQTLATLRKQRNDWSAKLADRFTELKELLAGNEQLVTSKAESLRKGFTRLAKELLAEDAQLVAVRSTPQYLQGQTAQQKEVQVPAFEAEMAAANRPGLVRRTDPTDVSESQRELVDLAFRLSLVDVATQGAPCTFVMETPEASLDGLAMERVGQALSSFARTSKNRLIVTSNLSNAGLITAMFGGHARSKPEAEDREKRLINLLRVAAPNRALERDRNTYETLLKEAVNGTFS